MCDILVKHRWMQARALGVEPDEYLPTLARRLRLPPRGLVTVETGPVKEVKLVGEEADLTKLPVPFHTDIEKYPYITAMNIVKDPETGFYNSSHAGTNPVGPRRGLTSFITPHTQIVMAKHRRMGRRTMPIALCFGAASGLRDHGQLLRPAHGHVGRDGDGRHHHGHGRRDGPVRDHRPDRAGPRGDHRRGRGQPGGSVRRGGDHRADDVRAARRSRSCRSCGSPRSPCAPTGPSTATTKWCPRPTTRSCRGCATRRCCTTA